MAEALVALSNFACEGAQLKFVIICSVFFQSVGECSSVSWKDPIIIFLRREELSDVLLKVFI